jgi:aromatic ring-opening dioxygenase LigB subunit
MSLIFSAVVPHPPILIPQIGKENLARLEDTQKAYQKLAKELVNKQVETILIISPHGLIQPDAFTMNLNPQFAANFEEFGDFSTKLSWPGDIGLTYKIRERMETRAPLQLISEEELDHGAAVPLYLLTQDLPSIKIIPLYYSGLLNEAHFKFGQLLNRELIYNKEQIAVIASGDLSHRLTKDAPAGYSPKGKKFDNKIIELLQKNKSQDIINLDHKLIAEAGECGLKSIIILLGILEGIKYEPQLLSYEAPFGVGYMVMNFKI